jgi:glutamate-1-semialdehyde 2,1-aminomutase
MGHLNAANFPQGYPQFFASGEGATLVDLDGRRFIDFMSAWGPNYLGYRHPEVEEAVQRQLKAGDCLNGPVRISRTSTQGSTVRIPSAPPGSRHEPPWVPGTRNPSTI